MFQKLFLQYQSVNCIFENFIFLIFKVADIT